MAQAAGQGSKSLRLPGAAPQAPRGPGAGRGAERLVLRGLLYAAVALSGFAAYGARTGEMSVHAVLTAVVALAGLACSAGRR